MSTARLVGRGWFGEHLLSTSHVLLKVTDQSLQKALEALSLVTGDATKRADPAFVPPWPSQDSEGHLSGH